MAKIVVENATVERVFQTQYGWGVAVFETYTPKGSDEQRKSWFTLWFKDHPGVTQGQVISASGFHAAKTRSYESPSGTKTAVDVSVNSARLIDAAPLIEPAPAGADDLAWADPPADAWAEGGDSKWA